jgi:thioredoxin-related protein
MARPAIGWRGWRRLVFASILAWLAGASVAADIAAQALPPVPVARDLAAEGQAMADQDLPVVVVLFSRQLCGWCDKARREHLNAMAANPATGALFRQVDVDSDARLVDFSGQTTSHRAFSRRHNVKLTPTLMFFAGDGRPLAGAIVGYRIPEFYGTLIETAVEDSRKQLRGEKQ